MGGGAGRETSRQASRHADKEVATACRQDSNNQSWKLLLDALSHSCRVFDVVTKYAQDLERTIVSSLVSSTICPATICPLKILKFRDLFVPKFFKIRLVPAEFLPH